MPRKISEEFTRKEMNVPLFVGGIDPQLESVSWYLRDHSKVKTEIPVSRLNLQEEFARMVARVELLRGWMGESTRQVDAFNA